MGPFSRKPRRIKASPTLCSELPPTVIARASSVLRVLRDVTTGKTYGSLEEGLALVGHQKLLRSPRLLDGASGGAA